MNGLSAIHNITILNSSVVADGAGHGSGIGTGPNIEGTSEIRIIDISNSSVIASSGRGYAAIGSGSPESPVGSIHFAGNCVVECQRSGNTSAIRASSILIAAASLVMVTDDAPLFGTHPISRGPISLIIGYHRTTGEKSEPLSSIDSAFLHVGNVNISDSDLELFRFCVEGNWIHLCFDESLAPIRSVILGTCGEGSYSFPASIGNVSRNLIASDGRAHFGIESTYSFIDVLSFPPSPSQRKSASYQFCDSIIVATSSVILVESVSPSARGVHRSGGANAARTTLVVIGAVVLVAVAGGVIVVAFRRQAALLTDSEVTTASSGTGRIPCPGSGNGLISLDPESGDWPVSPTGDQPESEIWSNNPVTVRDSGLAEE
jgi:hypothetical protein